MADPIRELALSALQGLDAGDVDEARTRLNEILDLVEPKAERREAG